MLLEVLVICITFLIGLVYVGSLVEKLFRPVPGFDVDREVPDELPDEMSDQMPEELYNQSVSDEEEGSERLKQINAEFDARISQLKDELDDRQAGQVYNINHELVDSKYAPIPLEEYAK